MPPELTTHVAPNLIHCEIISPEKRLFAGMCASVVAPARNGLLGVLPGHAPLLSELGVGIAEVEHTPEDAAGRTERLRFAIREGFMQVVDNKVTLLAVRAADAGETLRDELKQGLASAQESLRGPESEERFQELLDDRSWYEAQLALEPADPLDG